MANLHHGALFSNTDIDLTLSVKLELRISCSKFLEHVYLVSVKNVTSLGRVVTANRLILLFSWKTREIKLKSCLLPLAAAIYVIFKNLKE